MPLWTLGPGVQGSVLGKPGCSTGKQRCRESKHPHHSTPSCCVTQGNQRQVIIDLRKKLGDALQGQRVTIFFLFSLIVLHLTKIVGYNFVWHNAILIILYADKNQFNL
jgi:hypothetical protein